MDNIKDFEVNSPRWLSLEDFEGEVWKDIPGFNGDYMISNMGRAKAISRTVQFKGRGGCIINREYPTRILHAADNGHGYLWSCLGGRKNIMMYLHRLVAISFIPNPKNKPEIDHINTIKSDNRSTNLRWVTKSENMMNAITSERNRLAQGDPIVILNCWGEYICEFTSAEEAAKQFNVPSSVVKDAIHQKRQGKTMCGYLVIKKESYNLSEKYFFMYKRGTSPYLFVPSIRMVVAFNDGCIVDVYANTSEACKTYKCSVSHISLICRKSAKGKSVNTQIKEHLYYYKDIVSEYQEIALTMFKKKYPYPTL